MELLRYAEVLQRRRWVVLATLVVTLAVVGLGTRWMTPIYSATAMARITDQLDAPRGFDDLNYSERLMNTYVYLLRSRVFLEEVIRRLGLSAQPEELARAGAVQVLPNSELIRVTVESPDPAQAMEIANAMVGLLAEQQPRAYSIEIVEPAVAPLLPTRPAPVPYLALGLLVGLVGGVALAFLFENLDTTIHSAAHLAGLAGVPVLARIPRFRLPRKLGGRAVLLNGSFGATAGEAFRILCANVLSVAQPAPPGGSRQVRTLMIASAEPEAGRSTVLANLAVAVARTGRQVIVVDADLKHPELHRVFGLPNERGLAEVIANNAPVEGALQETRVPGVRLLSSGPGAGSPLNSARMRDLVLRLAAEAGLVLLDSPPVLASADAAIIAPLVDAVLLVVAGDRATERDVRLALEQLDRVGGRPLGTVFNKAAESSIDGRYFSSHQRGMPAPSPSRRQKGALRLWTKRALDVVVASIALALLSPLFLLIGLLIKLDSPGPIFFAHDRVGYDRRRGKTTTFKMVKFRSMFHGCDQSAHEKLVRDWIRGRRGTNGAGSSVEVVKLTNDPRVTRVGRFLRRTSLDELPQLWNVLKGDMSLVGPRPVPPYEVAEYDSWHRRRLMATPGITCLWQVNGRGTTSIDEMARLDIEYIEHQSLWLDLEILLRTIPVVLSGHGAV